MQSFQIALVNVLITLFYLVPGYIVRKMGKVSPEHLPTLSAVLVYIGNPFLCVSAFMSLDFSVAMTLNMLWFFLATLILQSLFMLLLYAILRKREKESKFRVLTIGSVVGNVGFFGIPILRALYPANPELACYSTVFTLSMNILIFTVGVFCLTGDKKYMSLKSAIFNPTVFSILIAFPVYLFGLKNYFPAALTNAINTVGAMTTPLCMFILGIRLASAPLKRIFSRPIVYVTAALKLLAFPLFCYAMVYFLPVSDIFKAGILVLTGMPCASVLLSMAEIHKSETEMAANCQLVSTLLCFLTIPILTLLL
ncbi:MAG: AEC family transporter [Clostridia bacterium]|nr:AEC family transporter [Clostridia bacterium]